MSATAPAECLQPLPLTAEFILKASAEPSVLARVLEPFALRNLVPDRVVSRIENDIIRIDVTVTGLAQREVDHLTLRLNQIMPVMSVLSTVR